MLKLRFIQKIFTELTWVQDVADMWNVENSVTCFHNLLPCDPSVLFIRYQEFCIQLLINLFHQFEIIQDF